MLLDKSTTTLERSGVQTEKHFTVKATGKAFEILSAGLYTDPVLAVIRELSCNARDAHVAYDEKHNTTHKATEPFQIHLPNKAEPYFEVNDFGIGMSEEEVMTTFTTYFESTKDDSNDFIGAYGLGSKSPFAYADSFQVVSRWDGVKTTYSIFFDEERIPSIAKMGAFNTTEHNGVSVRVSVREQDFHQFGQKTSRILKYFKVPPDVIGGSGTFRFEQLPDNPIKGTDWFVDPSVNNYNAAFTAVMGDVPYKVNINQLEELLSIRTFNFIKTVRIVAYFEMDELSIPPSREEIRYSEKSIKRLVRMCDNIKATLLENIEKIVADFEQLSVWESYQRIDSYARKSLKLGYQGFDKILDRSEISNKLLLQFVTDGGKISGKPSEWKHHTLRSYNKPGPKAVNLTRAKKLTEFNFAPTDGTAIFLIDIPRGAPRRLYNWWRNQNNIGHMYAIVQTDDNEADPKEVATEYQEVLKSFGHPPNVLKASDLPKPVGNLKASTSTTKADFSTIGRPLHNHRPNRMRFNTVADDKRPTEGLYFLLSRGTTPYYGKNIKSDKPDKGSYFGTFMNNVLEIINFVKGTNYGIEEIYGVNGPHCRHIISKDPKWTNVFDLVSECLPAMSEVVRVERRRNATPDDTVFTVDELSNLDTRKLLIKRLRPNSLFRIASKAIYDDYERVGNVLDLYHTVLELDHCLSGSDKLYSHYDQDPYFEEEDVLDRYPMLTFLGNPQYTDINQQLVLDYINLIDESLNAK